MPSFCLRFADRCVVAALCSALFFPLMLAAKDFVKPVAKTAINYPAHDFHRDSNVAIAADPYDTPEKAKIFSVDFAAHGFLPVFFVVTNDGDQPVSIANMEIVLITAHHSKLTPVPTNELYRRLSNPQASGRPSPVPLPLPQGERHGQQERDGGDRVLAIRGQGRRAARHAVWIFIFRRGRHLVSVAGREHRDHGCKRCKGRGVDVLRDFGGQVSERAAEKRRSGRSDLRRQDLGDPSLRTSDGFVLSSGMLDLSIGAVHFGVDSAEIGM